MEVALAEPVAGHCYLQQVVDCKYLPAGSCSGRRPVIRACVVDQQFAFAFVSAPYYLLGSIAGAEAVSHPYQCSPVSGGAVQVGVVIVCSAILQALTHSLGAAVLPAEI